MIFGIIIRVNQGLLFGLILIVLVSGCTQIQEPQQNDSKIVSTDTPNTIPASADNDIFDFLTKHIWENPGYYAGDGLGGTITKLEFRKNGEYNWTAFSDYPERTQSGKWNFKLTNEDAGIILLEDGSVISFQKLNDNLLFGLQEFSPQVEIEYSSEEIEKKRDSLPENIPSELYFNLIKNSWRKTNDFDPGYTPELITFNENGRFFASYRNNECTHGGWWSVDKNTLIPVSDPNNCDVRGNDAVIAASNGKPTFQNDLLVFYRSSYYNAENDSEKKIFIFDKYTRSVIVSGEYSEPFTENSPTSIDFTFQNVDKVRKQLGQFKISMQKLRPTNNTFAADGEEVVLFEKDYTGIGLNPNEKYQETIVITPPTSGEYVLFNIILVFKDVRQSYTAREKYFVNIK